MLFRTPVYLTWTNAPSCSGAPTTTNSVFDKQRRLWGWLPDSGRSCAYHGIVQEQQQPQPQLQADGTETTYKIVLWEDAPSCNGTPHARSSVKTRNGQFWGWEQGRSCAYRINDGNGTVSYAEAPKCGGSPNQFNSVRDSMGRQWGWESEKSCRF